MNNSEFRHSAQTESLNKYIYIYTYTIIEQKYKAILPGE